MTSPPSADPYVVSVRATGRSPVHKQRAREVWGARLTSCFFRLAAWLFVSGCSLHVGRCFSRAVVANRTGSRPQLALAPG